MIEVPRMLMISGAGRNVGKTTLAVNIIKHFVSKGQKVFAIKASSHQHPLAEDEVVLEQGDGYDIIVEKRNNTKDSSLMLQAGAISSYYIQGGRPYMLDCFKKVWNEIPADALIVCESGGLREYIVPGLMLCTVGDAQTKSPSFMDLSDRILKWNGAGGHENFEVDMLTVENGAIVLHSA